MPDDTTIGTQWHGSTRRTFLKATGALTATGAVVGSASGAAAARQADADPEELVSQMTLDEKVSRTHGAGGGPEGIAGYLQGVERLDVPGMGMADGPPGASLGEPTTDFPHPIAAAATFDPSLAAEQGRAIAREARDGDVDVLLAPALDMFRVPLHARGGETYGEDPHLSAEMAREYTKAVQSEGVVATLKHFAAYNQASTTGDVSDYYSTSEHNVLVDERALREIYFPPFREAVTEGDAGAVMPAYNRVNGVFCSENDDLLDDVLKGDWGFDGFVVSDWYGTHSTVTAAANGLDVEMPDPIHFGASLKEAVEGDDLGEHVVDEMVRRGLQSQQAIGALSGDRQGSDPATGTEEHFSIAERMAEESAVLLRNDGLLPFGDDVESVAVVGPEPESFKQSVGGSDAVDAIRRIGPVQGIEEVADVSVTAVSSDRSELAGPAGFAPAGGDGEGFTAEYFDNPDRSGSPVLTRTEDNVDLAEGDMAEVDAEEASVRWTATLTAPESGTYGLALTSQAEATLYLDGERVAYSEGGGFAGPKSEEAAVDLEADREYEVRVDADGTPPVQLEWNRPSAVEAAADAAADADAAVVLARSDTFYGDDRHEYELPGNQNALIEAVADANEDAVVLLNTETPVATPWRDAVPAVMQVWFPGQEAGHAVARLLFGEANPSGKTPVTWAESLGDYLPGDVAALPDEGRAYPGVSGNVFYDEGVFVGYRHFDAAGVEPAYPFGHGESYTEFEYGESRLSRSATTPDEGVTVEVDVTNAGDRDGKEAVQVYVSDADPAVERPPKELAGVDKVEVPAGEARTASVDLDADAFSYWDPETESWTVGGGEYDVLVGASSRDVRSEATVRVGEDVESTGSGGESDDSGGQENGDDEETSGSDDGDESSDEMAVGETVLGFAAGAGVAGLAAKLLRQVRD